MIKFCRFCGEFNDTEVSFCPNCGYKFDVRSLSPGFRIVNEISVTFIKNESEPCVLPFRSKKIYIKNITAYHEWRTIYNAFKDDCLKWKIEDGALVFEADGYPKDFLGLGQLSDNNNLSQNSIGIQEYWIQLTDKTHGSENEFRQQKVLVGRKSDCDLINMSSRVSRHHAELFCLKARWHILDMESSNGTTLNGKRLEKNRPYLLANGDEIGLPDGTTYIFHGHSLDSNDKIPSVINNGTDNDGGIPSLVVYREYLRYEQYDTKKGIKYWMQEPRDHPCSLKRLSQDERKAFLHWLVTTPPHATKNGDLDFTLTIE